MSASPLRISSKNDPAPPELPHEFRASPVIPLHGVPRVGRIFVNRNLRMRSIGAIGFDLDHTLAHYRIREVDELAFRITQQKLVAQRGYPEELLQLQYDPEFVVRGLLIDRRRGNVLKMDYHNYVVRAYHGLVPLSSEDRKRIYRLRRIRVSSESYVSVDTLFHMPEAYLYVAAIDLLEKRGVRPDYRTLSRDVREMIDEAHADGSIKNEIERNPTRFVSPDPRLPEVFDLFRRGGKKLFLLTNSELHYTEVLFRLLFRPANGDTWRSYFDFIVVDAKKPKFFRQRGRPGKFLQVEGPGAPVFSGGDVWALEKHLGHAGDSVLYWGDHTYGDILRSKKNVGWRTAMIIPELEHEVAVTERIGPELSRLTAALRERDRLDQEETMTRADTQRLEKLVEGANGSGEEPREQVMRKLANAHQRLSEILRARARVHDVIAETDAACNSAYNAYWGTLFREGNEISRFGHQIKDFACVYTSRVSNFLNYPVNTYFRAPMDRMSHEI
jgi:HAD superfamily 5'-nucleotidase-like hydrolase